MIDAFTRCGAPRASAKTCWLRLRNQMSLVVDCNQRSRAFRFPPMWLKRRYVFIRMKISQVYTVVLLVVDCLRADRSSHRECAEERTENEADNPPSGLLSKDARRTAARAEAARWVGRNCKTEPRSAGSGRPRPRGALVLRDCRRRTAVDHPHRWTPADPGPDAGA